MSRATSSNRARALAIALISLAAIVPTVTTVTSPAPASAADSCAEPGLSPSDPRAMWVEGSTAEDDGATRDYYNRAARLPWTNLMSDWRDADGTSQGTVPYTTTVMVDDDIPSPHSWDVTALVSEWRSGVPNQGLLLRALSGSSTFDIHSREYAVSERRPALNLSTSAGPYSLQPVADTKLESATYQGLGDEPAMRIDANPVLIRFDLTQIPAGASIESATLQVFSFAEIGGSSSAVGVFRVLHDPGPLQPVQNGLAYSHRGDNGIASHPDVYEFTDFETGDWIDAYDGDTASPSLALVSSGSGFEPIDGAALKVTVPAGSNTGIDVGFKFGTQVGSEPTEAFFRYYLRIDDGWDPTFTGKFPGFAGIYGTAGYGGIPSNGTNGWSARGGYQTTIVGDNPFAGTVPIGNYMYHVDMDGNYGDTVHWQDGLLGYLVKDRWYSIEQHLVLNSPGQNNGILETWIDGRLAYRQSNWRWRDTNSLKIEQVWLNVFHGGSAVPDRDISVYLDNVVVASRYIGPIAGGPCAPDSGKFVDDDDSIFESDIERLATAGITRGCNPPVNDRFCPDAKVTRGQMAAFLVRALGLTDRGSVDFVDDDDSIFEADIERLATAGITRGCNPPVNDRFCPDAKVTRGQMAAFLVRALGYADDGGGNLFIDDDLSIFEGDIDRLRTAGVTKGCNPAEGNTRFCPDAQVTRGQMAAFLSRALAG